MPTWGELLQELGELKKTHKGPPPAPSAHDVLRRKYLRALADHTGRGAIVYATSWLEGRDIPSQEAVTLNLGDKQGFMEAVSNIKERELDLIITSPGGSPEAAESIMAYLRTRFDHIRAVVPVAAMSAATMVALACDQIVMGTHSQLGPIDPQFTVHTPEGPRSAPGQAIIDQFEIAKVECQDPRNLAAWLPILRSLLPGLLAQCRHSREQAERFVSDQLAAHMLSGDPAKAAAVAAWFADFTTFKSHGRPVTPVDAEGQGLNVVRLEADPILQDLVLSVHHAVRHTINDTGVTKLIENHHGRAYLEIVQQAAIQLRPAPPGGAQPAVPGVPGFPGVPAAPSPNRAARRAQQRGKR